MMFFFQGKKWSRDGVVCLLFVFLGVFALGACQKENQKVKDPKETLGKMAETYWNKRFLEKDYNATYAMEAVQGAMTLEKYKMLMANKGQIGYISVKTKGVNIGGQDGIVTLEVVYQLQDIPKPVNSSFSDRWLLKDNEWKHVISKNINVSPK